MLHDFQLSLLKDQSSSSADLGQPFVYELINYVLLEFRFKNFYCLNPWPSLCFDRE